MSGSGSGGILVGGDVAALLAAGRRYGTAADEAAGDVRALAALAARAAAHTALAAPLSPIRAASVAGRFAAAEGALAASVAGFLSAAVAIGHAARALEAADAGGLVAAAVQHGQIRSTALPVDPRTVWLEEITIGGSVAVLAGQAGITVSEVVGADGRTVWLVSKRVGGGASADVGGELNGVGAKVEGGAGGGVTHTWALPTRADARAAVGSLLVREGTAGLGAPQSVTIDNTLGGSAVGGESTIAIGVAIATTVAPGVGRSVEITGRASVGLLPASSLPQQLRSVPAGATVAVRVEAPADPERARLVLTATEDRRVDGGTGLKAVDATNRQVRRETTTWTVELTDPDDVEAARRLAEVDPATGTEAVEGALRLARRADDLPAVEETTYATGTLQQASASLSAGLGLGADVGLASWEAD